MNNPKLAISFLVLLLGINLVSVSSSSYYEPSKYKEERKVPNANYDYEPKQNDDHEPLEYGTNVFSLSDPSSNSDQSHGNGKFKKPSKYDDEDELSPSYYYQSCPEFESIVARKVKEWIKVDSYIAASLLRLFFHDCVVKGCDASILLNHKNSEREAKASKTLRGYEVIDDIKAEVEKVCPKTVSCADILTAAARDATVAAGGEKWYWTVDYGRKDGLLSKAEDADSLVPMGRETVTDLIEKFQSLGLNVVDLVTLSGAHTIGRSSCGSIQYWLYNKTALPYSSINQKYFDYLQRRCRWASDYVELDATTPNVFDNEYYANIAYRKLGLLATDRLLYSDPRTSYVVTTLAYDSSTFKQQFKKSMVKLGNVKVLTGPYEGEIRTNCNSVNARY